MESKKSDFVKRYREYAEFQFAIDGEGLGLRQARHLAPKDDPVVMDLDALVIETLEAADYINPLLLEDRNDQLLTHWWWHLGKLRAGTYPAHLLPPHLRELYRPITQRKSA